MSIFSNYWFLLRYGVVGLCGGLIQTATLYTWVEIFHLQAQYLVGAIVGFCLALTVTFTLQKYWTFQDYVHTKVQRQLTLYTTIALLNLSVQVALLHLSKFLLEYLGFNFFQVWYLVAQVTIIVALATLSFLANYFFTFQKHMSQSTNH